MWWSAKYSADILIGSTIDTIYSEILIDLFKVATKEPEFTPFMNYMIEQDKKKTAYWKFEYRLRDWDKNEANPHRAFLGGKGKRFLTSPFPKDKNIDPR